MSNDLIARLEAATADQQYELLIEAFFAVCAGELPDPPSATHAMRFTKMLLAEAYESAALTLVPEGWLWRIMPSDFNGWLAEVWTDDTLDGEFGVRAATPALAICIAALKAKETAA